MHYKTAMLAGETKKSLSGGGGKNAIRTPCKNVFKGEEEKEEGQGRESYCFLSWGVPFLFFFSSNSPESSENLKWKKHSRLSLLLFSPSLFCMQNFLTTLDFACSLSSSLSSHLRNGVLQNMPRKKIRSAPLFCLQARAQS